MPIAQALLGTAGMAVIRAPARHETEASLTLAQSSAGHAKMPSVVNVRNVFGNFQSNFAVSARRDGLKKGLNKSRVVTLATAEPMTAEEAAANARRQEEAGGVGKIDDWKWTLNWDFITENIAVGSCPRTPEDLDILIEKAGVTAVICLQCDACFDALKIDHTGIRQRAIERGVVLARVAVRDFDHNDQAAMLPEAVRILGLLESQGHKVYVHCTAGINRATLTVVGWLTFIKGWDLNDAVTKVKSARSVAHPYIDCWETVRGRLIDNRSEELTHLSKSIYETRMYRGDSGGDMHTDWGNAEKELIKRTLERRIGCDASVLNSAIDVERKKVQDNMRSQEGQLAEAREQLNEAQAELEVLRRERAEMAKAKEDALRDAQAMRQELQQVQDKLVRAAEVDKMVRELAFSAKKIVNVRRVEGVPAGAISNGRPMNVINGQQPVA